MDEKGNQAALDDILSFNFNEDLIVPEKYLLIIIK